MNVGTSTSLVTLLIIAFHTVADALTAYSVKGAGGIIADDQTRGYYNPKRMKESAPVQPLPAEGGPTGAVQSRYGGPIETNLGAEFGPPVTPLPAKKPRFRCPKDLTYLIGRGASVTDFNSQYYNNQGGGVFGENGLNCMNGNLCCWKNVPFPKDEYQFRQVSGYVDPDSFQKAFNTEKVPESDFLIVKSPCSPDNTSSAELVSCTLGYVDNVTVTFRHWQTENVKWLVCTRNSFAQYTAETLDNCQDIPAGNGPDSVTLPAGELFDIVIVASNFVDRKSEMAVINDIQVNYTFAEAIFEMGKLNLTTVQTNKNITDGDKATEANGTSIGTGTSSEGVLYDFSFVNFEYLEEYGNVSSPEYQQLKRDIELEVLLLSFNTLDELRADGWTGKYPSPAQELCMNPWIVTVFSIEPLEESTAFLDTEAAVVSSPRYKRARKGTRAKAGRNRLEGVRKNVSQNDLLTGVSTLGNRRLRKQLRSRQKRQSVTKVAQSACDEPYDSATDQINETELQRLLESGIQPLEIQFNAFLDFCDALEPEKNLKCKPSKEINDCDIDFCIAYVTRCEGVALDLVQWVSPRKCTTPENTEAQIRFDAPGNLEECSVACSFEGGAGSCAYLLDVEGESEKNSTSDDQKGFAEILALPDQIPVLRRFLQNDFNESDDYLTDSETEDPDLKFDPNKIGRIPNSVVRGTVLNVPFMNRVSGILRAANIPIGGGKYYGAMYVTAGETVEVTVNTVLSTTRLISFQYYAATSGLIFKACCSENLCPIQTESTFDLLYFRRWRQGRMVCPPGSDKIKFVCHATAEHQGACGIDSVQLNYFDPTLAIRISSVANYPLNDACNSDDVFLVDFLT